MTKQIRFLLVLVFSILVISFTTADLSAAPLEKEISVHFKLGMHYVLFTKPSAPFINTDNRLMITAATVRDLMGGTVDYNPAEKTAVIGFMQHTYQLTAGSKAVVINGRPVELCSNPVIIKDMLYFPVRTLLDTNDLQWVWDQQHHLLQISDARAVSDVPFDDFAGNDFAAVSDSHALQVVSYSLLNQGSSITLKLKAINLSGHTIETGKADLNPLVTFANHGGYSLDAYSRPSLPPLPLVQDGGTVTRSVKLAIDQSHPIEYILCAGREIND